MSEAHGLNEPDLTVTKLSEIGDLWGLSNPALGRILDQAGYRWYGMPSTQALDEGLAVKLIGNRYGWNRERVGHFLETSGYKRRPEANRFTKELFLTEQIEFSEKSILNKVGC